MGGGGESEGDGDLGEKSRGGKWMNMGRGHGISDLQVI